MENYEGNEVKKGKSKWMLWAIIGIVAVVVIGAVVALKPGGGQANTSGLTIDDLGAQINTLTATVTPIVSWKATATEDIANLKSKVNALAMPKDWSADFAILGADITDLRGEWAAVNQTIQDAIRSVNVTMPRYAMVSDMSFDDKAGAGEPNIVVRTNVYGAGIYPVIITFYGKDIGNSTLLRPRFCDYTTQVAYVSTYDAGSNSTSIIQLVAFVRPSDDGWGNSDTIDLGVDLLGSASIDYAVAIVGCSWQDSPESPEGPWQS